jgi:TetR/AcrR family transcriptional regulator
MALVSNTEETILAAARTVFMQKGFAATRMCDIAQTANIKPALLHYYFRKKDKLFALIFEQALRGFHADIVSILQSDQSFFEKIRLIIQQDIQKSIATPYMPMFILNEIHSNPERLRQYLEESHRYMDMFNTFSALVEKEQLAGRIRAVSTKQLFLSILGLTTFPFLAQPMLKPTFGLDDTGFEQLMTARIEYASDMIIRSLEV